MTIKSKYIHLPGTAVVIITALVASGCTTAPDPTDPDAVTEYRQINDPGEPTNRKILEINRGIDKAVLEPIAKNYRDHVPQPLRWRISNFLNNLRAPVIFVNDVLQGEPDRALTTATRFVINSSVGLAGLHDIATEMKLEAHDEDFGQTLAVWGFGEGPYVMLPVLGPSNPRDTAGLIADIFIDPFGVWLRNTGNINASIGHKGGETIDYRTENIDLIEDVENSSLDFYASIRSLYRQNRITEINNGLPPAKFPDMDITQLQDYPGLDTGDYSDEMSFKD